MRDFSIGNLQILGSSNDYTVFAPIDGLDYPDIRLTSYDKPGEDGGIVSNVFYGMRSISINGMVRGSNCEQYEANRRSLIEACAINKNSYGYPTLTKFSFTDTNGNSYYFYGQIQSLRFSRTGLVNSAPFFLAIVAPDNIIYSSVSKTSNEITRQSGTGFGWPFDWPTAWGSTSGGNVIVDNGGNTAVYPEWIRITGVATNPYILNTTTDKFLQLNYTTGATDVIYIYPKEKIITLNGSTNLISAKTAASSWLWLDSGQNSFTYSTSSSSDTGTLAISWSDGYIGV